MMSTNDHTTIDRESVEKTSLLRAILTAFLALDAASMTASLRELSMICAVVVVLDCVSR